ncbi:MAG: Nitronate monooxygenase [Firmicutes bacterium]|nr:Nitronate monooxygenase [candidate division NPL-UPA2 bacterium]
MKVPELKIGNKVARVPIVQGGMGVGISLSRLAGAVGKAGGVGVISGVEIGFNWPTYTNDKIRANREALIWHIQRAKEIALRGVIGVNIMVAVNDYEEMVAAAVAAQADIIFSGAGLPLSLPALVAGSGVAIAPIVSSARAAVLLVKQWLNKYARLPDALVVEGPLAGGHLGFSREQLFDVSGKYSLETILGEVLVALKQLLGVRAAEIPVVAGGGLYSGQDIARILRLGASGVQMSTRFVATEECDAPPEFKAAYLAASPSDVVIIDSPVGMPGRALRNTFLNEVSRGERMPNMCVINCLKPCVPSQVPYCIASALVNAAKGQMSEGFAFCGSEVHRIDRITTVEALMSELKIELEQA